MINFSLNTCWRLIPTKQTESRLLQAVFFCYCTCEEANGPCYCLFFSFYSLNFITFSRYSNKLCVTLQPITRMCQYRDKMVVSLPTFNDW